MPGAPTGQTTVPLDPQDRAGVQEEGDHPSCGPPCPTFCCLLCVDRRLHAGGFYYGIFFFPYQVAPTGWLLENLR